MFDEGIRHYINRCEEEDVFTETQPTDLTSLRQKYLRICEEFSIPHPPGLKVWDDTIRAGSQDVAIRVFAPSRKRPPLLVFFHGGGWMYGNLDSHDSLTSGLAAAGDFMVIAVDYRLAPEHPYPAPFDDAWNSLAAIMADADRLGFDSDRVGVAGDSGGGNLAAGVALKARDLGAPKLCCQVLLYPALTTDFTAPSYTERAVVPLLTTEEVKFCWRTYLDDQFDTPTDYAAPLQAQSFENLPPAFVVGCEYDPLRDDAKAYVERLRQSGVPAELRHEPRLIHGYMRARAISPAAAASFDATVMASKRLLGA
ncbi:alpha/beta hydrolase [Mesorhizobium sp. B2-4-13]|uniref:alpha/beta hydrolase n=1 Tax=Mesorhizobium sp. B2-4-13 TaxID=2589936 RepID=UPI0011514435|nr:alpha/beta hydrolase [Mesorhizobium sp. B2-4-13]TPK87037.1 alpha/beta hydrolase [Mesorhizobium sp. B2-4-13]